ncbi:MAG: ribonuclease HI [Dehalococcoidia bacterium]|nr:ribonuclease HI [Dehalococcoidia bacterium]
MDCRSKGASGSAPSRKTSASKPKSSVTRTQDLSTSEVLARFSGGPSTGIFTDGSSRPNPGPGGWGAVYVVDGEVREERFGHEDWTTNNRMELTAMIAGLEMAPKGQPITVYSDSQLVVNTLTKWAKGWEAKGWKRREGEIANLDLVQQAWATVKANPAVQIEWIRAHDGSRWNEYADALSTAHLRSEV